MKNSFFRKTTCIALSFLMMASLIVAETTTVLAETEVLYSCSFPGAVTYDDPDTTTRENVAGRASMGTAYGWNSWETNTSLGTFHYDEDTDRNYIALKDSYVGKGAFSISDSAVTTGKVYMSFSYRKPGDATGNIFLRIIDGNGTKYHFARIGSELGLCSNTSTAPSYTIGDFEGDKWHELGFVFDLDAGTLTGYADGKMTNDFLTLPDDMNGISYLGIALNSTAYSGDVTDFMVKRTTGENTISVETRVDGYEITAQFNEPIGSPITAEDVSIEMCGSSETVSVADVYYSGTTVKVTYDGELTAGREYRVNFGTSAKTLFGKNVPPAYFYLPAVAEVTGLSGASDGSSVVNEDGVIDFENLTVSEDTTAKYKPIKVTDPTDFYTYFGTRNTDRANVNVVTVESTGVTDGNSSVYALEGRSASFNFAFGEKLIQNDTRTVVYEFKYLYNLATTNAGRINLAIMNPNGTNNQHGRIVEIPLDATAWHTMKVVYDRVTPKIDVYRDNNLLGSYTTYYNSGSKTTEDIPSFTWRIGIDYMSAPSIDEVGFYIDDFKQSYVTDCAGVESVRYVDINNTKSGLDLISSATKAIEIKFSEDMDESTLEDIVLTGADITGTSYDADTYTYTIELGYLLTPESGYILTIPESVCASSGASVQETEYSFMTDIGIFELSDLRMESYGEEVTDISAIAGEEVTLNVNMVNTLGIEGDIVLIYSLYENDALVDINYEVISLGSGMENFSTSVFTVREGINPDIGKVFIRKGSMSDFETVIPCVQY